MAGGAGSPSGLGKGVQRFTRVVVPVPRRSFTNTSTWPLVSQRRGGVGAGVHPVTRLVALAPKATNTPSALMAGASGEATPPPQGSELPGGGLRARRHATVGLGSPGGDADPGGGAVLAVTHEHVTAGEVSGSGRRRDTVGVVGDQVEGPREEGDVATVGADGRQGAVGAGRGVLEGRGEAGAVVQVDGKLFDPGLVRIWFDGPSGQLLAELRAAPDGTFTQQVRIPANAQPGPHSILATLRSERDGRAYSAPSSFVVEGAASPSPPPAQSGPPPESRPAPNQAVAPRGAPQSAPAAAGAPQGSSAPVGAGGAATAVHVGPGAAPGPLNRAPPNRARR